MTRLWRALAPWFGMAVLLAGTALAVDGGARGLEAMRRNVAAREMAGGHDLPAAGAAVFVALARARFLIAHGQLDAAQAIADRMAREAPAADRAELLYALGNARMRQGLAMFRTVPFRKVAPVLSLAKAEYRQAIQLDPDDWDARYNYALAAALVRDTEAAQPTAGAEMAHERAAWPDIPGAPNGMP